MAAPPELKPHEAPVLERFSLSPSQGEKELRGGKYAVRVLQTQKIDGDTTKVSLALRSESMPGGWQQAIYHVEGRPHGPQTDYVAADEGYLFAEAVRGNVVSFTLRQNPQAAAMKAHERREEKIGKYLQYTMMTIGWIVLCYLAYALGPHAWEMARFQNDVRSFAVARGIPGAQPAAVFVLLHAFLIVAFFAVFSRLMAGGWKSWLLIALFAVGWQFFEDWVYRGRLRAFAQRRGWTEIEGSKGRGYRGAYQGYEAEIAFSGTFVDNPGYFSGGQRGARHFFFHYVALHVQPHKPLKTFDAARPPGSAQFTFPRRLEGIPGFDEVKQGLERFPRLNLQRIGELEGRLATVRALFPPDPAHFDYLVHHMTGLAQALDSSSD